MEQRALMSPDLFPYFAFLLILTACGLSFGAVGRPLPLFAGGLMANRRLRQAGAGALFAAAFTLFAISHGVELGIVIWLALAGASGLYVTLLTPLWRGALPGALLAGLAALAAAWANTMGAGL